jgi:hypothetical protein
VETTDHGARIRVSVKVRSSGILNAEQKVRFGLISSVNPPLMPSEYLYTRRSDYVVIAAYGYPTNNEAIEEGALNEYEHLVDAVLSGLN